MSVNENNNNHIVPETPLESQNQQSNNEVSVPTTQEEQSKLDELRNKYGAIENNESTSDNSEKKSFIQKAKEWFKNTIEKVTSAIKNLVPTRKEGDFLERAEVRVFGGKDAYNKLYVSPDVSDEELVHQEENRASNLSNEEKDVPEMDPSKLADDAAIITQNGNKVTFQELPGTQDGSTLVSFVARTPAGTGIIAATGNGKTINEATFQEVKDNIQNIKTITEELKEREKYRYPLRAKEEKSKTPEGGTFKTEKFRLQNTMFKVTHAITSDGKHNISAFSPDKNISFVVCGEKSFKDAVSTLEGLVASSEEVLKNHPLNKDERSASEPETEKQEEEKDTPVEPSEEVVEDEQVDEPVYEDDEPEISSSDELPELQPSFENDIDEPIEDEPIIEEPSQEAQPVVEMNDTKENELFKALNPKHESVLDEIIDDEPVDEAITPSESEKTVEDEPIVTDENETVDEDPFFLEKEETQAIPNTHLKAVSKEIDASDLSKGDIISQNGHHYIVTSLNKKRQEMSFATIEYDTQNQKWSPYKGSTAQTVPFDRVPDFSLEKKGEKTELQKGDTFRTYNGVEGVYTGKKIITLSNGQKTPIIPELVVKEEKILEKTTDDKSEKGEESASEQEKQKSDMDNIDFSATTAPVEQPDVDEIEVDDDQDQPNNDAPIKDQCI